MTLDPDVEAIVRRRMRDQAMSFKEALNDLIRTNALAPAAGRPFRTETASLGVSQVNLDRALQVVADLEDDELVRKARAGQ